MSDKDYFKRAVNLKVFDKIAFRAREGIFEMFLEAMQPLPSESIIDIGVFGGSQDPDQNFLEKFYKYPRNITAVGVEDASFLESQYPGLKFIKILPGRALPFKDGHFDIGFSSAVIEHVGLREDQRRFLAESIRVCRRFFLTTPNRFYPVECHTRLPLVHWLPQNIFRKILKMLKLDFYSREENLNLLNKSELSALVPDAYKDRSAILFYRLFGIASNLILSVRK